MMQPKSKAVLDGKEVRLQRLRADRDFESMSI